MHGQCPSGSDTWYKYQNANFHAEIVEMEIEVVSPSIIPSGNFAELNRTVTCMVLKANDRRTSSPMNFVSLDLTTSDRWH
ncbi:hypothetical protein TNCV_2460041 [Trichonephila clavipes]|nr:hypothetical protein TNCV_2460041 [Trichonephila clavipes]